MAEGTDPKCSECDSSDVVIKKSRKSFCKVCWNYSCEFRFRKRLFEFGRPAKGTVGEVFKPAEHTIICYDGSPSSVALINLALNALISGRVNPQNCGNQAGAASTNLPFPFRFSIVVILESELNGSPGVEGRQKKHLQYLMKWINYANKRIGGRASFHFPLLASSLEVSLKEFHSEESVMMYQDTPLAVLVKPEETGDEHKALVSSSEGYEVLSNLKLYDLGSLPLPFNESLDFHLMELRKSMKSKTDDKDFIGVLKKNLLYSIANQLKVSKILLPEDQTSLAVKMFSMMSLGRGSQVADEMTFTSRISAATTSESNQSGSIFIGRPLIDFSDEDLRIYLDTLGDECQDGIVSKGGNSSKRKMKIDTVERQCDDFIVNLQKGYPSTVSTLTRIGAKLQSQTTKADGDTSIIMTDTSMACKFCRKQVEISSNCSEFCYGCQAFLQDEHPEKKEYFKNLFQLKNSS